MKNSLIFCPYCGKKTPEQNYCINCGQMIKDITEKQSSSSNGEEIIITEIIVQKKEPSNETLTISLIRGDKTINTMDSSVPSGGELDDARISVYLTQ